jgi:hypothetical protein
VVKSACSRALKSGPGAGQPQNGVLPTSPHFVGKHTTSTHIVKGLYNNFSTNYPFLISDAL